MKLALTGKGGVGKTALAAGLARFFASQGKKVLAIDADPDQNLACALEFPRDLCPTPINELKELIEERVGGDSTVGFRLNPEVDDLPERCSVEHQGIRLMVMGSVSRGGSGCMCRPNSLARSLVRHLILERDECLVLDMVAGVEHLGRGTASGVDAFLVVVEPHPRSLETAKRVHTLASDIGISVVHAVGNKVRSAADRAFIVDYLEKNLPGLPLAGTIRYSQALLDRVSPTADPEFMGDVGELSRVLPG